MSEISNANDLAKARRKALLKELYDFCVPRKNKLKVLRIEAIRAGFVECWKTHDYATIVAVDNKLLKSAQQEDPTHLMCSNNARIRI